MPREPDIRGKRYPNVTSDANLATLALADAAPVEYAPGARGPAVAGAVTGIVAIVFGFLAGRILGNFAGLALVPEALAVFLVAMVAIAGFMGLDTPWWSVALAKRWPQLAGKRTMPWPGYLYFVGVTLVAPAATYLGVLAWADGNIAGLAWKDQLAVARPAGFFVWMGMLAVMVIAWRICFAPFSSELPRWVPLPILTIGAGVAMFSHAGFDGFAGPHWWGALLAIAWGYALAKATPARLGYAVAATPTGRVAVRTPRASG